MQARREKISERMKILQDLVPGCNKVSIDFHLILYGSCCHGMDWFALLVGKCVTYKYM